MSSDLPPKSFLRNYSLPKILIHLNRRRATGTLSVTAQGVTRKIFIERGNAIFASSTYEDDRLGEMLLKAGKIDYHQYDQAVQDMKHSGKRLGAVLVGLGILTPDDLFQGVKYQVEEIIYSLFRLKDGLYEFGEGEVPPEVITLDLSTANIIHEGVRRIDDWTRIKSELPDPETVFVFSDDPRSLFQAVEFGEASRKILSLLDGERTMKQVMEASGFKPFDAMKSFYVLWTIGIITDQFGQESVTLTLEDILRPVEDRREEFAARVESIHAALGTLSHYQLLAVPPDADLEKINAQYYKLAKEFHPDRYGDSMEPALRDKISEVFDAIAYAYESLKSSQTTRQFSPGDMALAERLLESAKAEIKGGNPRRAVDFLKEAVDADPENAECWNYISLAHTRLGRLKDAETALRKAQEINPNRDDYHANLGLLYLKTGRNEEAMKEFERALSLNPGNSKAQKGLSRLLSG